tara:strand:- start:11483 stop:12691 length:1209 start_codon:yes stop_codon:yes gene_type:complete
MEVDQESILFLGFYVSKKSMGTIMLKDKYPSIQTYKYSLGLLRSISNKHRVKVVSVLPVSDYPMYSDLLVKGKRYSEDFNGSSIDVSEVSFFNRGLMKLVTRFILVLIRCFSLIAKRRPKFLLVYSVHVPFMIIGVILSLIFRIKLIGVWTDPPAVSHAIDGRLKKILRGLEFKISCFLMKRYAGAVVLSKHLALDFMPGKPYLVVESILNDYADSEINKKPILGIKKIVYTGSVNKKYGIPEILKAIESIARIDFEFHIYGSGDYQLEVERFCEKDSRVFFHGFVIQDEIANILSEADFLINIRSSSDGFVKYSFPSKITEYMASGTPVIATMLPGMPSAYENLIINVKSNQVAELALILNESLDMSRADMGVLGAKAKGFIEGNHWSKQSYKIESFLSGL